MAKAWAIFAVVQACGLVCLFFTDHSFLGLVANVAGTLFLLPGSLAWVLELNVESDAALLALAVGINAALFKLMLWFSRKGRAWNSAPPR